MTKKENHSQNTMHKVLALYKVVQIKFLVNASQEVNTRMFLISVKSGSTQPLTSPTFGPVSMFTKLKFVFCSSAGETHL